MTVTLPELSVAVASKKLTTAPQIPASLLTLISRGQAMAGFSLSITVTVKLQSAKLPAASVALNVFVVVPIG